MGKLRTSSNFYRRGIPDKYSKVGANIQGNYSIIPNTILFKNYNPNPFGNFSFQNIFISTRLLSY
jgi:hypothetical protein